MQRRTVIAMAGALLLVGCGRRQATVHLYVESNADFLEFRPKSLTVPAGAKVILTFHHAGTIISQQHDWVLAKPGTMVALLKESDMATEMAGGEERSFLKPNDPRVVAATPLIKKGATTTITFTAPAPGDYPYFCSTSGHADTMRGVLHVTPA
jgi:azurin